MLIPLKYVSSQTSINTATNLAGSNFDVEIIPLVGNLEYFWPGETVDTQLVAVD
jgi:hypothetical protein